MWVTRRFQTNHDWLFSCLVAIMTFGEGWHNNHHAHPTSARHGLAWYEVDLTWLQIRVLRFLGIADRVRVVDVNGRQPGQARRAA